MTFYGASSSIGRAAVSKTAGYRFKSYLPRHIYPTHIRRLMVRMQTVTITRTLQRQSTSRTGPCQTCDTQGRELPLFGTDIPDGLRQYRKTWSFV